jgi:hypothetical protein
LIVFSIYFSFIYLFFIFCLWAGTRDGENGEVRVEGFSVFVLSAMRAIPIMGLPFGGDEKRLVDLFFVIEEGRFLEDGVFAASGSLKIWNAPLILTLEAVALVGVKGGLLCRFRTS